MVFHKSPFENEGVYQQNSHRNSHSYHKQVERISNAKNKNHQVQYQALYGTALRSNQSMVLPGMGIIGRSIKFEVGNHFLQHFS